MRKFLSALLVSGFLVGALPHCQAVAQDFGQLLEAVSRVKTDLKAMINQEAKLRSDENVNLRKDVDELRVELKQLARQRGVSGQGQVNLASLQDDLNWLIEEFVALREQLGDGSRQLTSIGDEFEGIGAEVTVPNDFDLFTERLYALSSSLEELIAVERAVQKESPRQYVDIGEMATPDDQPDNSLMEFAGNMQVVVDEFEVLVEEIEEAEKQRENPAGIKHGHIMLSGFLHQQYYNQSGDEEESTFLSKRARLKVSGDLNDYATLKLVGEFANDPKLLDGVLTLSPVKNWKLCVGQFKTPFGTDLLTSSTAYPFVSSSLVQKLCPNRDVGASLSLKGKLGESNPAKITVGIFNGSGINVSDGNSDKNFVARAEIKLAGMFTIAPNLYLGKNNESGDLKEDIRSYSGSVSWSLKNAILQSEYVHSRLGETRQAAWLLWGGYTFKLDSKFLPELQPLVRYEQYDSGLGIGGNRVDRITFGANLFVDKKYTKIQVDYQINTAEGTTVDNNKFLVNFQVAF